MNPAAIIAKLLESGIEPQLTEDASGIMVQAKKLTWAQRSSIVAHKPELIEHLMEIDRIRSAAIEKAMRKE